MNWDAIGAVGEVIGAVAVVGTLVFLAVQVRDGMRVQRETNALARAAAGDRSFDQFTGFRRMLATDPDTARLWMAGCAAEQLDVIDNERFNQLAVDYLFLYVMMDQRARLAGMPALAERAVHGIVEELRRRPGLQSQWGQVKGLASWRVQEAVRVALES